jgi:cell division protein ZapA (FtsZ GTPase activity inhibitor)
LLNWDYQAELNKTQEYLSEIHLTVMLYIFLQDDYSCLKCKYLCYEKKVGVQQFQQNQQNEQLPLTSNPWIQKDHDIYW